MNKKFKNIWFIWHGGMKSPKSSLPCQMILYLACRPIVGGVRRLHYSALLHATCQTCQMFKRKIVKQAGKTQLCAVFRVYLAWVGGGYTDSVSRGKAVYPPPERTL